MTKSAQSIGLEAARADLDGRNEDVISNSLACPDEAARLRVCVVGSGTRFLSGISYYTNRLTHALARDNDMSVILMRQLLPTRLYPGRDRVGMPLTTFSYPPGTRTFDGVDWFWGRTLPGAMRFLLRERPDVIVMQWWSGTVLHTYLGIAALARAIGARLIIEFHEILDTGELKIALARRYVGAVAPLLFRAADGYVVHNEFDRTALQRHYGLGGRPVAIVPHGPYDQYLSRDEVNDDDDHCRQDDGICNLLYFGVIRPFKGVEDIIAAFDAMDDEEASRFRLTVVGETWEGWTLPGEMIARSRHRGRITFVNRYVNDAEVASFFAAADAAVLPYRRSSASGPLHLSMASGLTVVVTDVGGLVEASEGYEGVLRIPPSDPAALRAALHRAWAMRAERFADVHSWDRTLAGYTRLFCQVRPGVWAS